MNILICDTCHSFHINSFRNECHALPLDDQLNCSKRHLNYDRAGHWSFCKITYFSIIFFLNLQVFFYIKIFCTTPFKMYILIQQDSKNLKLFLSNYCLNIYGLKCLLQNRPQAQLHITYWSQPDTLQCSIMLEKMFSQLITFVLILWVQFYSGY